MNVGEQVLNPAEVDRPPSVWRPLGLIAIGLFLIPLDGAARQLVYSFKVGGDVRRELELLQQFGDLATTVLAIVVILLLDPASRLAKSRRVLDWALAFGLASGLAHVLKVFIGRPRPVFDDPAYAVGPIGQYPVEMKDGGVGLIHTWSYGHSGVSDLWSMPSSHAVAAGCMGTVLSLLYPRLRWLCAVMVAIVCLARVVLRAHYPSDVLVGSGIGWWIASAAMAGRWGSRLVGLGIPAPQPAKPETERADSGSVAS